MTRREKFINNTSDTLSASCIAADTTLTVTTGSKWPTTGDFRILIDSEIMLVTGRSGNTLTVVRGQEGTTAAAHGSASIVTMIISAGGLDSWLAAAIPAGGSTSGKPPFRLCAANGDTLTSSDYSVVNLSTSTISDVDGAVVLRKPGNAATGENFTLLTRPYTAPASVVVGLRFCLLQGGSGFPLATVGIRDSVSGRFYCPFCINRGAFDYQISKFDSPTSQNSVPLSSSALVFSGDVLFFKCEDDGTLLKFSISLNGTDWVQTFSEARTTYLSAPNQFFFGSNNYVNTFDNLVAAVAWSEG